MILTRNNLNISPTGYINAVPTGLFKGKAGCHFNLKWSALPFHLCSHAFCKSTVTAWSPQSWPHFLCLCAANVTDCFLHVCLIFRKLSHCLQIASVRKSSCQFPLNGAEFSVVNAVVFHSLLKLKNSLKNQIYDGCHLA